MSIYDSGRRKVTHVMQEMKSKGEEIRNNTDHA